MNDQRREDVKLSRPGQKEPRNLLFDAVSFASINELTELSFVHHDRGYKSSVVISSIEDEEDFNEEE